MTSSSSYKRYYTVPLQTSSHYIYHQKLLIVVQGSFMFAVKVSTLCNIHFCHLDNAPHQCHPLLLSQLSQLLQICFACGGDGLRRGGGSLSSKLDKEKCRKCAGTRKVWNHLPTKLESCHSITRFKSLLKTHLMSQFFKDDVYL